MQDIVDHIEDNGLEDEVLDHLDDDVVEEEPEPVEEPEDDTFEVEVPSPEVDEDATFEPETVEEPEPVQEPEVVPDVESEPVVEAEPSVELPELTWLEEGDILAGYLFSNADCTGDLFDLYIPSSEVAPYEMNAGVFGDAGWNDKGGSIVVFPGFMIELWQHHPYQGIGGEYYGSADMNGNPVCQSLGNLADEVSSGIIHEVSVDN